MSSTPPRALPEVASLPTELRDAIAGRGSLVELPAGRRIYGPGQSPTAFLIVLDGSVRVQQVSESGREIVLYRVAAGESCALTTACLMGHDDYPAEAIAETAVKAIALPRQAFDEMIAGEPAFRRFVFQAFSHRMTGLFHVIEEVAFGRMDIRMAHKLIELSHGGDHVAATQQQLAAELGTAREVVSRMLSEFQRRGWVAATRGSIAILDRPALERLGRTH